MPWYSASSNIYRHKQQQVQVRTVSLQETQKHNKVGQGQKFEGKLTKLEAVVQELGPSQREWLASTKSLLVIILKLDERVSWTKVE